MAEALTDADIRKIAKLSRLSVADSQVAVVRTQLSSILGHIAQLQALPVEGVEPIASVLPMQMKKRPDVVTEGGIAEDILANAPAREDNYFVVPKVVE